MEAGNEVWVFCDNRGQMQRLRRRCWKGSRARSAWAWRRCATVSRCRAWISWCSPITRCSRARLPAARVPAPAAAPPLHDYASLRGDFVVHVDHGVGRLRRHRPLATGGFESECLRLRYQDGDSIYVPADQINPVQKYVGGEGGEPPVVGQARHRAVGAHVARARKAVEKMAGSSGGPGRAPRRKAMPSRPTASGSAADGELRSSTRRRRISARPRTRSSATWRTGRPMDRLVCGDVGYGKTEVAIRAAFKAVQDGKQVAVLVPTTLLAAAAPGDLPASGSAAYPVRVDMLIPLPPPDASRSETIAKLAAAQVDVVIGTHRLLSKDVEFKDLGLRRRRRGAALRRRRTRSVSGAAQADVDVLTLTATPIPRTLQHGAAGPLRDISVDRDAAPEQAADRHRGRGVLRRGHPQGDRARGAARRAGVLRAQPRADHRRRLGPVLR